MLPTTSSGAPETSQTSNTPVATPSSSVTTPATQAPSAPAVSADPSPAPSVPAIPSAPSARDEIYERYNRYYGSEPQNNAAPVVSVAASAEPAAQAGLQEDPAQPTDPNVPSADALPPNVAERFSTVEQQLAQIVGVLSQLTQATQSEPTPPNEPAANAAAAAPAAPSADWLELLRQGKVEEAENALASKLANKFVPQAKSEALEMFREQQTVETELTKFITDLRGKNPDLVPLEELIASKAKIRLEAAQATGKLRTTDDYIKAYKDAVNFAADDARKIAQTIRAAGKEDANLRNREVLGASPVAPNAVNVNRATTAQQQAVREDTVEDYLARRRASAARTSGLAA